MKWKGPITVEFFRDLGSYHEELLRPVPTDELTATLIELMSILEQSSSFEDEILLYSGAAVAGTGHVGVDRRLLAWAAETGKPRRWAQVLGFLCGYWARGPIPACDQVDKVLALARSVGPLDLAWRCAFDALSRVYTRRDLPADRRPFLRGVLVELRDALVATNTFATLVRMCDQALASGDAAAPATG